MDFMRPFHRGPAIFSLRAWIGMVGWQGLQGQGGILSIVESHCLA